jgi:VWFA-related protein
VPCRAITYDGWNAMRLSFGLVLALRLCAQAQAPPSNQVETAVKDEPATFKARVNLVMVPVVVRDKQGRAIGTLKQEDFQLLDKGKPQLVSRFSLEKPSSVMSKDAGVAPKRADGAPKGPPEAPERYVAYLFDDIHMRFEDMARVRDAAWAHIRDSLRENDRAAIYSTSGQSVTEFTDDKDKLRGTLFTLRPRPITNRTVQECPDIGYYMADLIQNHNDTMALSAAITDTMACMALDKTQAAAAESIARATAQRQMAAGEQETRLALGMLRDVVRRMASTPGQRMIVLASPGFVAPEDHLEESDVIDRAIRNNVTINSLDARGLWTDPGIDASRGRTTTSQYLRDSYRADADILAELALGTGGTFFENNNDLAAGFRKLAEIPEYVYVLGFSPQNLKLDGSYHSLKIILRTPAGLSASARRGYYAPRHLSDPVETAKEEIREALFSREEMREIPVDLQSQFFKPSKESARVTVVARVDLKALKFRKAEDRQVNNVTVVIGIFDRNGNFVTGTQKLVEMKLKDETLARPTLGITVRGSFDVQPGGYLLRVVVRDAEGQLMTAINGSADIP